MRVVLDTHIFVSGLLSAAGPPARIVQTVLQRRIVPVMSAATFEELEAVLHRPKFQAAFARAGVNLENFLAPVRAEVQFVTSSRTTTPLRNERDRPFLDLLDTIPPPQYFVTADQDFDASHDSDVPVISAAEFVRLLKRA